MPNVLPIHGLSPLFRVRMCLACRLMCCVRLHASTSAATLAVRLISLAVASAILALVRNLGLGARRNCAGLGRSASDQRSRLHRPPRRVRSRD
jgi:hypothetical protein